MKKVISLLLLLSTLIGMTTIFASCKKDPDTDGDSSTVEIPNNQTVIADFSDSSVISASGLSAVAGEKSSENAGAITLDGSAQSVKIPFSKTDLSEDMEFSIWIKSTSEKDVSFKLYVYSDDLSTTNRVEMYYINSLTLSIKNGWNQYRIPFSDFTPNYDTAIGWENVTDIEFAIQAGSSGTITFESVYVNSQKIGTTYGFKYDKIANAVCFYEDCGLYFYNQLRYALNDLDEGIAVVSDDNTMYVPIQILAQHRGATDINVSEDKQTLSFTYNSKSYEIKVGNSVEYTGIATGNRPGRALSSKCLSEGDYILVPMEYCADIFGYELFYNEMGIAIYSDIADIYNIDNDYDKVYELIEALAYKRYTGAELLRNMDYLYPEDQHVRLFASQADFDRLKNLIKTDSTYAAWFARFEESYGKDSNTYKNVGTTYSYFELADGFRLLSMSRDVMGRILPLALMYKLTDDEDYAERVYKELYALSKFKDPMTNTKSWHPEHFLDTGEIMYGFSIGYDWCYDYLEKNGYCEALEEAVWEMGYGAAFGFGDLYDWWQDSSNLAAWEAANDTKYNGYSGRNCYPYVNGPAVKWTNNWSTVCNGGMTAMALAFANVEHDEYDFRGYSEYLLDCVQYCIPACLKVSYAPDGGYPEGPGYWSYGTTYAAVLFCCLRSATGSTYGYFNCPGFGESFYYIANMASTEGKTWNYHDAGSGRPDSAIYLMYAKLSGDTNIGAYRYNDVTNLSASISYWDLIFYDPDCIGDSISMVLDNCYYGIKTVTFRSSWSDKNSLFCGLHGGDNDASHGQLDLGNFILEYNGTRFFMDLGSDEYNLMGYVENTVTYFTMPYRMWYYRMRAEGHNTLVVNPTKVYTADKSSGTNQNGRNFDQLYYADSDILAFESGDTMAYAVVDMGCAYIDAKSGERGMWVLNNRSTVIIQDEVTFNQKSTVYWFGHMSKDATYEILDGGKQAIITIDGLSLLCTIVTEDPNLNTTFSVMAADYLPETGLSTVNGEYSREGYYKLVAKTTDVTDYKVAIVCSLLVDGVYDYQWTDIADWYTD